MERLHDLNVIDLLYAKTNKLISDILNVKDYIYNMPPLEGMGFILVLTVLPDS